MKEYKHTKNIKGIDLSNKELAIRVGDLYYDSLSDFLNDLSEKLNQDAILDKNRGREKLSNELFEASANIKKASKNIDIAWNICEPYVKKWFDDNGVKNNR